MAKASAAKIIVADQRARGRLLLLASTPHAIGVPTFFLGEQMFWGNDRLPLLEHALRKAQAGMGA